MLAKIICARDEEFKNKKEELVRGVRLTFLDEQTGKTYSHFVGNDNLKGYDPKQLCTIKGKSVDFFTTVKEFGNEKPRIVLEKIIEVV